MTPERHHQIRACYEAALALEPAAREAFLDRECQGDQNIRQEVERLLSARERLPGFLAGPKGLHDSACIIGYSGVGPRLRTLLPSSRIVSYG
jgi:hypothetical protein